MNAVVQEVKDRLRGTWLHHFVWTYRHPSPEAPKGNEESGKYRSALYDRQTVEVMFRVLHRNSTCIDIGAHSGEILHYMVSIAPRGTHFAFEPLPDFAQRVRERFPRVVVHQAAVADVSGESDFQFVENDPAYSGLRRRIYYRPDPRIITTRVRVVTLDEIIPKEEKIDLIKIDVEGGEYHALKGGIETIRRGNSTIIFEAGSHSTGQYGVHPDDVYLFVTQDLQYQLSTMQRWLERKLPYTRQEFAKNWYDGPDFYFIAAAK